jgi:hypothetical protein
MLYSNLWDRDILCLYANIYFFMSTNSMTWLYFCRKISRIDCFNRGEVGWVHTCDNLLVIFADDLTFVIVGWDVFRRTTALIFFKPSSSCSANQLFRNSNSIVYRSNELSKSPIRSPIWRTFDRIVVIINDEAILV